MAPPPHRSAVESGPRGILPIHCGGRCALVSPAQGPALRPCGRPTLSAGADCSQPAVTRCWRIKLRSQNKALLACLASAAALVGGTAHAVSIYPFVFDGCTGGCGVAPYGEVDVNPLSLTSWDVTVKLFGGSTF